MNLLKLIVFLACGVLSLPNGKSQELIFERDYQGIRSLPVKFINTGDGGIFYLTSKVEGQSAVINGITRFDANGKKVYSVNFDKISGTISGDYAFVYDDQADIVYAVNTSRKKNSIFANVIRIEKDGKTILKSDIPVAEYFLQLAICNNEVLLFAQTATKKLPSGEFEVTVISADFSTTRIQKLNMPEDKSNLAKYKLVGINGKDLYFIAQFGVEKPDDIIEINYEFVKYDFEGNKIVTTQKSSIHLDGGEKYPRDTYMSPLDGITNIALVPHYQYSFPGILYNNKESAFFIIGTYGNGYHKNPLRRKHEGYYITRFDSEFKVMYSKVITDPEMQLSKVFTDPHTMHSMRLLTIKGKTVLSCSAKIGMQHFNHVYEVDVNTGDAKLKYKFEDQEEEIELLKTYFPSEIARISTSLIKDKYIPYLTFSGSNIYLWIDDFKKNNTVIYKL